MNKSSGILRPVELRCEYVVDPIGVDTPHPRLSWKLPPGPRGRKQSAYRVLVSDDPDSLRRGKGNLWDSGQVDSGRTVHIEYAGAELSSGLRCHWFVCSWDEHGTAGEFSEPAWFETGLLDETDWQGTWIRADESTSAPMFRKAFDVGEDVVRARAYICGLGYYELYINGQRVGDHVLDPNPTNYDKRTIRNPTYPFDDKTSRRVLYVTYDVTGFLRPGANTVGVMLGNGWHNQTARLAEGEMSYGPPRLFLQLNIEHDGTVESLVSDDTWRYSAGPVVSDNLFYGEVYDARLEQEGWHEPGFDDSGWKQAETAAVPAGPLQSQLSPPDKVVGTVDPVALNEPRPGMVVFDMGRTFSGWAELHVAGPAGTKVQMRFAEELTEDGMLDFASAGGEEQIQQDTYVLKGDGKEVYRPRFTWHCFRYVDITGLPNPPTLETLRGLVVHSAVDTIGRFECSDRLLNRIHDMFCRTILDNYHGCVPSDCPHRERLGYTGDGQVVAATAMLNLDVPQLYTKWTGDIFDAQNRETGFVPHTAPFSGGGGGPAWGAACVIVPWEIFLHYADTRVLETCYPGMERWMDYLAAHTDEEGIVVSEEPGSWCLGEWSVPKGPDASFENLSDPFGIEVPPPLVNTFYYVLCSRLMARIAGALDRQDDGRRYRDLADRLTRAFHDRFFDPDRGCYSIGRQGADVFALAMNAPPPEERPRVLEHLLETIDDNDGHLDTGIFGTPLLFEVLTQAGRADLAYAIMTKTTYPGFGYMLERGATTVWENWAIECGSHCHPMYAGAGRWFYHALAGLEPDPDGPGYERIIVRPQPVDGLDSASAEIETIRGRAAVSWQRLADGLAVNVTVPPGSVASVHLPATGKVLETNVTIWDGSPREREASGIGSIRCESGAVVVEIESGDYRFTCKGVA